MNSYTVKAGSAVKKDIKKFPFELKNEIRNVHFAEISKDPYVGYQLGKLFKKKGIWSYHFKFKGKDYRIAYRIFEKEKLVAIVMIGPRERFYNRLRQRLR